MAGIDEIRAERLKKVELLRTAGMDPYPAKVVRTHTLLEARNQFETLEKDVATISVVGRALSVRGQGGILFVDLFDGTGKMQALIKKDDVGDSAFDLFVATVDASDFIELTGTVLVTKRGEKSVAAQSWRMIAKSLRPVPEQWFGLKDEDERYRKRYLDILLNTDVADIIRKRSIFWNSIRQFMLARGYVEVETPTLETLTGGAEARPFVTHHNALDIDVFLRISVGELWQKKLLIGGIPKTFEIGRIFRNEGISAEHAQDYTSFEFYTAYEDATTGVPMLKDLYRTVAQETFGTTAFSIRGFDIDLAKEWGTYDYNDLMLKEFNLDPRTATLGDAQAELTKQGIAFEKTADLGRCIDLLWKKIRKSIAGPAILTGMPLYLEPLAKKSVTDPRTVERFQILIAGSELGKAFNELNDPIDQHERFTAQQALRDKGDDEAQMADYDFVEALEYGMPPAFGFGVSERLFSFLIDKPIREAQAFPLMRPKE
jgi:lysyl-tRNA synthetase class 2